MPEAQHRSTGHRVSEHRSLAKPVAPARGLLGASRGAANGPGLAQFFDAGDQGGGPRCVGFSFSRAIQVRAAFLGVPIEAPSELGIYFAALALERRLALPADFPPNGKLPELTDAGCDPVLAAQGIQEIGACGESAWPYDDGPMGEAKELALEGMQSFTLRGAHPATMTGPEGFGLSPQEVMQAIDAGFPFPCAIQVDDSFQAYAADSPPLVAADPKTIPKDANGNDAGGHMTLLLDYGPEYKFLDKSLWASAGGKEIVFVGGNSWGKGWGRGGTYVARQSFVTAKTTGDGFIVDAVPGRTQAMVDKHMAAEQARHDAKMADLEKKAGAK